MNRVVLREFTVFCLLLILGIVGRWAQPEWNFTPLAAVTAIGGFYFRQTIAAVLLPVGILTISNMWLPAHASLPVLASVYLMTLVPLVLGRSARNTQGMPRAALWAACGVVPATAFYLVTNFTVWAFNGLYDTTFTGLLACYTAAIPFYRTMLVGDLFYLAILLGCLAAAHALSPKLSISEQAS